MYEHLLMEEKGQIAVVTVNNPKSLNALNSATLAELNECLAGIEKRRDIRVVIVTGSGAKAFVAGADISEMVDATAAEGRAMALLAKEAFYRLEKMPQVTIAAVNGYALGGGCELAMSCDIRIAAENAVLGLPECGLGILPGFGGTQRLRGQRHAGSADRRVGAAVPGDRFPQESDAVLCRRAGKSGWQRRGSLCP